MINQIDLPLEKAPINEAYIHFAEWATSGGTKKADWYQDLPGYRNEQSFPAPNGMFGF